MDGCSDHEMFQQDEQHLDCQEEQDNSVMNVDNIPSLIYVDDMDINMVETRLTVLGLN